ncbi:hypothetical protein Scep_025416 [Stephania cephalantha]|uniref:NAC domain-containing protein n=1 Tax=Stephania cephalantha TaxID=152367 RepID=A0AAP0ENF7_9MAGN
MKMMSKVEFVEVLDADEELRLVTAGFVEACHECPYKERTPFLMSWGRGKIRSALKNNRDSSRPPQRQLAQPSRPLMITGAGEDHDDDKEKVVGNENGAASGRENKEEAEILMSEEEKGLMNQTNVYFYVKKSGKNRGAGNGRWNASNGPINIFSSEGEMMGERRSLVYYNSKEKIPAKKTRWIMNEYRLPNPQPAIMSDSSLKDPFWTLCKIGETGRTSGDDDQVLPRLGCSVCCAAISIDITRVDNVELVPQEVTGGSFGGKDYQSSNNVIGTSEAAPTRRIGSLLPPDQLDDNSTDDEEVGDDQDRIENLESTRRLMMRNNNHSNSCH